MRTLWKTRTQLPNLDVACLCLFFYRSSHVDGFLFTFYAVFVPLYGGSMELGYNLDASRKAGW